MRATSRLRRRAWRVRRRAIRGARRRFFTLSRHLTPYLAVETTRDLVFLVSTDDSSLGPGLFAKRARKEMRTLALALDRLATEGIEPRGVFLDVGANIGTTALDAPAYGFEHVLAFEPAPANYRLLTANIALNDAAGKVRAFPVALSDRVGIATLDVGMTSSGKPWIVSDDGQPNSGVTAEVETTTLDELVTTGVIDPASVGMIWLDVEGHEAHVLSGGRTLLACSPPLVLEFHPRLLERGGGAIGDLLRSHYTHIADLRRPSTARLRPISELTSLVDQYRDQGFSDFLACRLP